VDKRPPIIEKACRGEALTGLLNSLAADRPAGSAQPAHLGQGSPVELHVRMQVADEAHRQHGGDHRPQQDAAQSQRRPAIRHPSQERATPPARCAAIGRSSIGHDSAAAASARPMPSHQTRSYEPVSSKVQPPSHTPMKLPIW